jgi:hypothetical protein
MIRNISDKFEKRKLIQEQTARLEMDREFWSDCLTCQIEGSVNNDEAAKAVQIADLLLEARRERFPL